MTPLICVAILLYTPYVCCQYTVIWYDNMEENSGWTVNGAVTFGYDDSLCVSGHCALTHLTGDYPGVRAWIRKSTDVSLYQSLRIKYSVGAFSLNSNEGDECRVYYSYTSNTTASRILIDVKDPPDSENYSYPDNVVNLPDASQVNTVFIWLETCCKIGGDYCYWDEVSLEGAPLPTNEPSAAPSDQATESTNSPTNQSGDKYRNNESIYLAVIICVGVIIFIYLLYKFTKKIDTLLRATRGNKANMEREIADDVIGREIEPGTTENNASDVNKARVKMSKRQEAKENEDQQTEGRQKGLSKNVRKIAKMTKQKSVEGKRDNDDIDESDDSDGLYVKNVESETTTNGNTPNTTLDVDQTPRETYDA